MTMRPATPGDAAAIRALLLDCFPGPGEADLVEALRAAGDAPVELVANEGEEIVGHVMFSRMDAPFPALALAPVAVAATRRRRGSAAALIREGLEIARSAGWKGVFVLGDPAYYGRFGFDAAMASGFDSPYAGPYLMALALDGDTLPAARGRLRHATAFGALE